MESRSAKAVAAVLGIGLCLVVMIVCVRTLQAPPGAEPPIVPLSVVVSIDNLYPVPACIGDVIDGAATASLRTGEGGTVPAGSALEYRWRWEFLGDGRVATATPALESAGMGWTGWHPDGRCTVEASFSSPGEKSIKCAVQARLLAGRDATGSVLEAVAVRDLTVINLQDSPRVYLVSRNIGEITLGWARSPSASVAGYKYHIEPYRDVLYDVGNVTQVTITGLTPGQEYTIHVHAYDSQGHTTR